MRESERVLLQESEVETQSCELCYSRYAVAKCGH